jgi:hypothetical protein
VKVKVQDLGVFHGIASTQLVEHPSFKALNKASKRYGHYLLNQDRRLFVKYRTNDGLAWQFGFSTSEIRAIKEDRRLESHTFVILVCGYSTVCALSAGDLDALLDLGGPGVQSIRVEAPPGRSMIVSGSHGRLPRTLPHKSYPAKLFA